MRLTLRTLLAWLDDTLPPEEVREIGSQVSETPYAQTLVDRIRKVTRRRRLTVPPNSGPEAVDPNIVSAYLDNELEAEKVAEYEKLCLSSDVHLAEAASCHQILSLIKNKAKVPPEARYRMYRLFKGPEAVRTNYKDPNEAGLVPGAVEGVSEPPWSKTPLARPSLLERVGPPLIAVTLISVLIAVGYLNLRHADVQIRETDPLVAANGPVGPPGLDINRPEIPRQNLPAPAPFDPPGLDGEVVQDPGIVEDPESDPDSEAEPETPLAPAAAMPAGVAAVVESTDGVVLRSSRAGGNGKRTWERVEAEETLAPGERLVNLAPFRTILELGSARVTMVAQAEIRAEQPELADSPRFELIDGSVVLRSPDPDEPIAVGFEGKAINFRLPPGQPVGLSWLGLKSPGAPAGRPLLTVLVPEGTLAVSIADADQDGPQEFEGPTLISIDPEDGILGSEPAVMPRWVVDPEPQPADVRAGEDFAELFDQSTGSLTFTLLEGIEDPESTIRTLSVAALGAMSLTDPDALEQVTTLLNRPGDPAVRATALGIVMRRMARGVEPAEEARALLSRFIAPSEAADDLDRLLLGPTEDDANNEAYYAQLVADLSSENPSVRQLAIETLQMLTGRDDAGYAPDSPGGSGLSFWQDLLKEGRLGPAGQGGAGNAPAPGPRG